MKKFLLFTLVVISFVSCKKNSIEGFYKDNIFDRYLLIEKSETSDSILYSIVDWNFDECDILAVDYVTKVGDKFQLTNWLLGSNSLTTSESCDTIILSGVFEFRRIDATKDKEEQGYRKAMHAALVAWGQSPFGKYVRKQ